MRKRIFTLVDPGSENGPYYEGYDIMMIIVILFSLVPLASKELTMPFLILDRVTVSIFIVDYILRWITADYYFDKKGLKSFLKYPFTPMAIIDLLSILPSIIVLNQGIRVLKIVRLVRTISVFRVFKMMRYSRSFYIIERVILKSRESLIAVCILTIGYIFTSAIVVFNVEPKTFDTFFDAIYWATVSLTTIGYGDITPVTIVGKFVTIISSLLGVAVVALPASIITAGYMDELQEKKREIQDNKH